MKRLLIFAAIGLMVSACGNKTNSSGSGADSTLTDSLNTVEAVVRQVNAVYDFWNRQRAQFSEENPKLVTLDEQFGTREWRQVTAQVRKIDRECECGGVLDFGDGPLDAWVYDCFEGKVRADSIEARLMGDGKAEVKFLVKDAVTTKGVPMRWLMRVEDGQWRVADIFFTANGNMDLLKGMKEYCENDGTKGDSNDAVYALLDGAASPLGYVSRYLKEMERIASKEQGSDVKFSQYEVVDIDGDGRAEILVRSQEDNETYAAFAVGSGKPELLVVFDSRSWFVFYQGAVGFQGSCGTGCHMSEYAVVRNSRRGATYSLLTQYGMDGEELPDECVYQKDGKDITAAEAERLFKPGGPMGKDSDYKPAWQDMLD